MGSDIANFLQQAKWLSSRVDDISLDIGLPDANFLITRARPFKRLRVHSLTGNRRRALSEPLMRR